MQFFSCHMCVLTKFDGCRLHPTIVISGELGLKKWTKCLKIFCTKIIIYFENTATEKLFPVLFPLSCPASSSRLFSYVGCIFPHPSYLFLSFFLPFTYPTCLAFYPFVSFAAIGDRYKATISGHGDYGASGKPMKLQAF